ncbi:MAG TPA: sigma 54-interacting transcriptional regulator [Polyangium sp.]|nr:sigma 54-interacting transcriptional regulator [Polyangium sp.]
MNEIFTTTEDVPRENELGRLLHIPFLFVVLHGDKPILGGARYSLAGFDEVTIGRGPIREILRVDERRLELRLPSSTVSKTHARFVRRSDTWFLDDLGSRNGCAIQGERITSARVQDGDFIEIGSVFLRFRASVPTLPEHSHNLEYPGSIPTQTGYSSLVPTIAARLEALARIAHLPITTLLLGSTGTGKEVLATGLHALSRRPGPFVAVNCGGLTSSLVESQLFGHIKGAFTGALRDELGFIRSADTGTLFLDEIGDLPLPAQATLLRMLQEREVFPVGGSRPTRVDVRVVAATNKPLDALCIEGAFRSDLLARLAGYRHTLPLMNERIEDIGLFLSDIVKRSRVAGAADARLSTRVARRLLTYSWPLNIRELENLLTVSLALASQGVVEWAHLPESLTTVHEPLEAADLGSDLGNAENQRERLESLLRQHQGNVSAVAREMGRSRMQVHRWLQRFGIDLGQFR